MTDLEIAQNILDKGVDKFFKEYGWIRYYNSWIHEDWIKDSKPYDRMATSEDHVIFILKTKNKENERKNNLRSNTNN